MKIVLDTNVLVSALIKKGKPRALLLKIIHGRHELVLSNEILQELGEVMAYPKIRRYVNEEDIARFLRDIGSVTKIARIRSTFKVVKKDPQDDIILRTCYDSRARYVVSGDSHLLALRNYRGIKIVTIDEMLEILKARKHN